MPVRKIQSGFEFQQIRKQYRESPDSKVFGNRTIAKPSTKPVDRTNWNRILKFGAIFTHCHDEKKYTFKLWSSLVLDLQEITDFLQLIKRGLGKLYCSLVSTLVA